MKTVDAPAWWTDAAVESTRELYPDVPAARPEVAGNETSTRLHLLVYRVLRLVLGPEHAGRLIDDLGAYHCRLIYRTVRRDEPHIAAVLWSHDLLPAAST